MKHKIETFAGFMFLGNAPVHDIPVHQVQKGLQKKFGEKERNTGRAGRHLAPFRRRFYRDTQNNEAPQADRPI